MRKGIEAWLTLLIELMWNKQRILEMYLNIAQFGDRTFGVEAASQQFFQISAQDLTPEEAALLAAVLPGPELYSVEGRGSTWVSRGTPVKVTVCTNNLGQ